MTQEKKETFIPNRFKQHAFSKNETDKYLFANNQKEFSVQRIETFLQQLDLPVYPHRNTGTEIFLLKAGTSRHTCGIDDYELTGNSVFIVPQGYLTSIQDISPGTTGFYCHFDFSVFSSAFISNLQKTFPFLFSDEHPHMQLDVQTHNSLEFIFGRLLREASEAGEDLNYGLIGSYLIAAFREINLFHPKKKDSSFTRHAQITSEFKELLYTEIRHIKTAREFAARLNITPNHLNKAVKANTGRSVKQLMNEALLLEAKNLLYETDFSINEIAYELGIDDPAYFSRFFKQHTGFSPIEYRKRIEKSN